MTGIAYVDGVLQAEGVRLADIAQAVGTPAYVYSQTAFEQAYDAFAGAFADRDALVCFAVKANSNLSVIRVFADRGAGADVVSGGELARALAAGVPADKVVFAGVGKTESEMEAALAAGILQFNVESEPEMILLDAVAGRLGVKARIALRINPDVAAGGHAKITTGKKENKFGVDIDRAGEVYALAKSLENIQADGVACHIGSQILDVAPYEAAYQRLASLVTELRAQGHDIRRLDLGGGVGVPYRGETPLSLEAYAAMVKRVTDGLGCRLIFEPGRYLSAEAGLLLSRVVYVKEGGVKSFLILDAAMNDLMRPALYDAWHEVLPALEAPADAPRHPVDVVGPVCETGDTFARDRHLPLMHAGDLAALMTSGAYGAVMASSYNSRPAPPEVLVKGDQFAVIKPRRSVADLFADEAPPPWRG